MEELKRFLDEDGKINSWPRKHKIKDAILSYLSEKFEKEKEYTEKEVNTILEQWHTFGDFFLLRRGLIEKGLLQRTADGSKYWR